MPLKKVHGVALKLTAQNRIGLTSIVHQEQRGDLWCWAACISMVLQGLGCKLGQCSIAGTTLSQKCKDCASPCTVKEKAYKKCDVDYPIKEIDTLWKGFKVQANPPQRPISSKAVLDELKAGHALEILLGSSDDGGHLVLIIDAVSASAGSTKILVADPSSTTHEVSPKSLKEALKDLNWGEWRLTWTGLHF